MIPHNKYADDLDEQIAAAIADGDYQRLAADDRGNYPISSLLSVAASVGRYDLVMDLVKAGGRVEYSDFETVQWGCGLTETIVGTLTRFYMPTMAEWTKLLTTSFYENRGIWFWHS